MQDGGARGTNAAADNNKNNSEASDLSAILTEAVNALALGMVVCNRRGKIVFANGVARALARQKSGVRISAGVNASFSLSNASDAKGFMRLIRETLARGTQGAMQVSGLDDQVLITVSRILHGKNFSDKDLVLIGLQAAKQNAEFTAAKLRMLFKLSPLQASIAVAIYNGSSVGAVAAERGVKITTVRTHLSEIFARTGAKTQSQLIRLLAAIPPIADLADRPR